MRTLPSLLLMSSFAVGGCSLLDRQSPSAPPQPKTQVSPVTEVIHGVADADYQLGRYFQGRNLREEAVAAYRRALQADPSNVEAHNGLGVVYAGLERYGESEAEFKAAIALAPKAVHLHNNLGYCYLLQGRTEEALARFRDALALEPGNRRLLENVELAEASRKDRRTGGPGPAVPVPPAPPATGTPAQTSASVALAVESGRVEPAPAASPSGRTPALLNEVEIANGNGVTGMARRTARYFASQRIQATAHLTNQKPYNQAVTEIQYRAGYESQARSLDRLLARPARLVVSDSLRPRVSVRLVLGRDAIRRPLFAETEDRPTMAALGGEGAP